MSHNEHPNYYAIIPANVRYDKTLRPNAKLLYGEITALSNKEGCCWATNSYFANLYDVDSNTISKWISQLNNKGYITISFTYKENKEIDKRIIQIAPPIDKKEGGYGSKDPRGMDQKGEENNTSNNNTRKNIPPFIPPSLEEVKKYKEKENLSFDPIRFHAYYSANDWKDKDGKPVKNWKNKARLVWAINNKEKEVPAKKFRDYK